MKVRDLLVRDLLVREKRADLKFDAIFCLLIELLRSSKPGVSILHGVPI